MKQERVILSFIAVLIGLLVAGVAFYFYQTTKVIPNQKTTTTTLSEPTPTPKPSIYLIISTPTNEEIVDSKTLEIKGKTNPDSTILVITSSDQEVIEPSTQGNFATTVLLDNGENSITIQAISPTGETISEIRTVTYSTADF
jgi:hypothetical protein